MDAEKGKFLLKSFECQTCEKAFSIRSRLFKHEYVHEVEKQFECDKCGKKFRAPEGLYRHRRRIHGTVRPFACDECGKRYYFRGERDSHTIVHSDEKPFVCIVCKMCYKRKRTLHQHMCDHEDKLRRGLVDKKPDIKLSSSKEPALETKKPIVSDVWPKVMVSRLLNDVMLHVFHWMDTEGVSSSDDSSNRQ